MRVQIPSWKGAILRGERCRIVQHRDTLRSSVQKRLNRSRGRLGCGLGLAQGIASWSRSPWEGAVLGKGSLIVKYSDFVVRWRQYAHMGGHIGATLRTRLNRPSAVAMRSCVKLLWSLALILYSSIIINKVPVPIFWIHLLCYCIQWHVVHGHDDWCIVLLQCSEEACLSCLLDHSLED